MKGVNKMKRILGIILAVLSVCGITYFFVWSFYTKNGSWIEGIISVSVAYAMAIVLIGLMILIIWLIKGE